MQPACISFTSNSDAGIALMQCMALQALPASLLDFASMWEERMRCSTAQSYS